MTDYREPQDSDAGGDEPTEFSSETLDIIERAWDAIEEDEIESAIALFSEARDAEPDNPAVDFELADALFELGHFDEVVSLCRSLEHAASDLPRLRRLLGLALHERGDHAEALPMIEAEANESPDDALIHASLGDVLAALESTDLAIAAYRKALAIDPTAWGAHHGWGLCLAARENFAGALDHYRAALALDENLPEVYLAWGEMLITLKDWTGARGRLLKAVELDEEYAEAWESLSYVCDHIGNHSEALSTLRRAIFWNSDREELLDYLATTYHPHLDFARSWDVTISGRYVYPDAGPGERTESHRFRRTYQVWAPDRATALEFVEEIEGSMWHFEYSVEEISATGTTAQDCYGGVVFISDRLYESPLPG
jgi:tetratricopeptide (TPR) repeat protein